MPWSFDSRDGKRSQGIFVSREEAMSAADAEYRRDLRAYLGKNYRLKWSPARVMAISADYPEHYSVSFDCVVRSRRHHKALQRERGTHDWEPVRDSTGSYLSKRRTERQAKQRAIFNG